MVNKFAVHSAVFKLVPAWILALGCVILTVNYALDWLKAYREYSSLIGVPIEVQLLYRMSEARNAGSFFAGMFFTTVFFLIAVRRNEQSK